MVALMMLLLWQTTVNGRFELHVRGQMSQVVASDDLSGLLEVSSVTSSRNGRFALGAASTSLTPQDIASYHGVRTPTSSFQGRGTIGMVYPAPAVSSSNDLSGDETPPALVIQLSPYHLPG